MKTLAILFLSIASAFAAQTPEQIQADIESRLGQQLAYLRSVQAKYRGTNDSFFTGTITHSLVPAEGLETPPDRKGQNEPGFPAWDKVGQLPVTMKSALELKNYVTPDKQHGYFAILRFKHGTDTWRRMVHIEGPLTNQFTRAWEIQSEVTPEEPQE
jgi:hypothetical protein